MSARRQVAARQMPKAPAPVPMVVEDPIRKRPWEKVDADGNVIKRKKVPGAKNLRIRKHVQPRNALACLHELVPGVVFETEQEGAVGQQFGVAVTIEGNTYRGYGSSLKVARQNAAEAALVSFVKPPVPKSAPGEENENMEDKTPWATLASFAMYKLFNDWKDGRIGNCSQAQAMMSPMNLQSIMNRMSVSAPNTTKNAALSLHLGTPADAVKSPTKNAATTPFVAKPAAKVPDNAATLHPLMVLHQMRPGIEYTTEKTTGDNNLPYFYVSVNIDGQEFTGEGPNLKRAKTHLARDAIYGLFGVESCFEIPA